MKYLLGIVGVLLSWTAFAQLPDDEPYYPYVELEERSEEPFSDSMLFYRLIRRADDLYGSATDFTLPRVTIHRRGEGYGREELSLHGVPLPYRQVGWVRALGGEEQRLTGVACRDGAGGSTGGSELWSFGDAVPLQPYAVSAHLTERNYRVGGRVQLLREVGAWTLGAVIDTRQGSDARIEGVSTNALSGAVRLSRKWSDERYLTLFASLPYSVRGLRSSATEEAFALTDNPYYNPSWGLQDGKVRNARMRREVLPYVMATYRQPLTASTCVEAAFALEMGQSSQSGLGWYDARSPLPDNYRYMPSYTLDRATEEAWLAGDLRLTQIDWDELVAQNRLQGGEAIYALEDRVSRPLRSALRLDLLSRLGEVELRYGARLTYDRTRHYKAMRDLLGASYLTDIDHYLIDDDSYANQLENNLRDPSRTITEGARFGYDYALSTVETTGRVEAVWQRDRLHLVAVGEVGHALVARRGYYEKELFAGSGSFGRSRRIALNPYRLAVTAGWSFSPRRFLELSLATGADLPRVEHLFVQPLYNNRTISSPRTEQFHALDLRYRQTSEKWEVELSAFARMHLGGVETRRYFDDLSGEYADLEMADLGTLGYGVEGALVWRPAYRWRATMAASWGAYRYARDAKITILADADNRPIEQGAVSHLRDSRVGGAPAVTAAAEVQYYGPRGWGFRFSGGFVGGRYVDAAPLRRTDRVARQNGVTEEAFEDFTEQERLADAVSLNLSLYKRFYLSDRHTLQVALHATNLLGQEQIAYGYESLRSMRVGQDTGALRMPHPTRYLYATPRTVSLRLSWQF